MAELAGDDGVSVTMPEQAPAPEQTPIILNQVGVSHAINIMVLAFGSFMVVVGFALFVIISAVTPGVHAIIPVVMSFGGLLTATVYAAQDMSCNCERLDANAPNVLMRKFQRFVLVFVSLIVGLIAAFAIMAPATLNVEGSWMILYVILGTFITGTTGIVFVASGRVEAVYCPGGVEHIYYTHGAR